MPTVTPAIRDRLAEACLELLRIPSPTGQEANLVQHLRRWALGQRQLSRDDILCQGNTLVIGHPDTRRPSIALVGHLDTVPPHEGDLGPAQQDDKLVGLGASDMKGAVAVMQVLIETLDLMNLPFSLMAVLYDREEGPYRNNGLEPLLERCDMLEEVDFAIAMEPTDNTLQLGCMGSIQARVSFRGQAAHAARPWQGDNAIHKAGPLLVELQNRKLRDVVVEGLVFREAVSATLAKGGHTANTIPDRFDLNLNYRFAPTLPIADAVDNAVAEVQRLGQGAEVEIVDIAPPGPVPVDNPILEHLLEHGRLKVAPKQAWTDVARLAAHGIDGVNFGPGATSQAHQRGEWVSLNALVECFETLTNVLSTPLEGMR